jgi:hypothetical protein
LRLVVVAKIVMRKASQRPAVSLSEVKEATHA